MRIYKKEYIYLVPKCLITDKKNKNKFMNALKNESSEASIETQFI